MPDDNDKNKLSQTVMHYDVNALKKDVIHHRLNIEVFTKAIKDAKNKISELEGYIKTIESSR